MDHACRLLTLSLLFVAAANAHAENSLLWGAEGEGWDSAGPLPDFSFAGYQRGEKPIPDRDAEISVTDFGATPDDDTDDTEAFLKAIADSPGKVIAVPAGRYIITDILKINQSGTVLQGAGSATTVLVCPKPLHDIKPDPLQNHTAKTGYSWSGGIVWIFGSSFGREIISPIQPDAKRGDRNITLAESASGLAVGDTVIVAVKDDDDLSLVKYLYANEPGDISNIGSSREERQFICRIEAVEGNTLTLDRPLRFDLRVNFSPELRVYDPRLQECGIEGIGFEFPEQPYGGHFSEDGYNAISIQQAVHCWARDIRILNCDSGLFFAHARFSTLQNIIIESNREPGPRDNTGHHGIQVSGEDNLVTDFEFRTKFVHDLTVDRTIGCVFSNGKGIDISMDHHRRAPYENLFSNIDLGKGERAFDSGGNRGIGHHAAAGNTYWNIQSKERIPWPENFGPDRLNWIGVNSRERKSADLDDTAGRWVETLRAGNVEPADLHAAQLERRTGGGTDSETAPTTAPTGEAVHTWTNSQGREIRAAFVEIKGDAVVLKLSDGKTVPYPLNKLSTESRKQAQELAR